MGQYEILICPVCLEQAEPSNYEESAGCYHREYGGDVKPMTVPAHVMATDLSAAKEAADPILEELLAKETARREKREAWEALPQAEKDRIKAEEWAAMSPFEKGMRNLMDGFREDLTRQLDGASPLLGQMARVPTKP